MLTSFLLMFFFGIQNSIKSDFIIYPISYSIFKKIESGKLLDTKNINKDLMKMFKEYSKIEEFDGKSGSISLNQHGKKYLFIAIGDDKKENEINDLALQKIGGSIADKVAKTEEIALFADLLDLKNPDDALMQIAFGVAQKNYRFSKYLTKEEFTKKLPKLKKVNIAIEKSKENQEKIEYIQQLLQSIYLVRDLVNEPANVIFPDSFAKIVEKEFKGKKNIEVEILGKKEMQKLNANMMLGVSAGSDKEPKLVIIKYIGNPKSKDYKLALVGKGVTFDSGGYSLKPSNSMEGMNGDMAGAATVFGTMKLLSERNAKINVIGLMGMVENLVNGSAQKVNDIVTSMSGQTVEILNTDAEGRLVLGDVLYYAQKNYKPEYMIDLATLTGAMVVALGSDICGYFSNSDKFSEKIFKSSEKTGDKCWRMPLGENYNKMINSEIADMKNISGTGEAGSATAAVFLQRFIDDNKNWAHFDIAGVSDSKKAKDLHPAGASGFGIKLLDDLIKEDLE